jgi:hypothetical protein
MSSFSWKVNGKPCRICGGRASRPKQLCSRCSADPEKRRSILSTSRFGKHDDDYDPRPQRQPGDAPWRCIYCMAWRCARFLDTCEECDRWYEEAKIGMPDQDKDNIGYRGPQGRPTREKQRCTESAALSAAE